MEGFPAFIHKYVSGNSSLNCIEKVFLKKTILCKFEFTSGFLTSLFAQNRRFKCLESPNYQKCSLA